MIKTLVLDVETTVANKGNPFTVGNKLCYVGYLDSCAQLTIVNLLETEQEEAKQLIQTAVDSHDWLVAFNAKFDCHWLENIGVDLSKIRIWDCQVAEFLLEDQLTPFPSLNGAAQKYELPSKLDIVAAEFWDKGVDTVDIPPEIMVQYLEQDVRLTEQVFAKQYEQLYKNKKWRLFQLCMEDQVCLREMERNGILYDVDTSLELAKNVEIQIADIEKELRVGYDGIPINFDSPDDLSAYLYGGTISVDTRVPVGVYKTGAKTGLPRYKIVTHTYTLPRVFTPPEKSALKKEGLFSADENTRRVLQGTRENKKRLDLLDKRAKYEKLRGTYFSGFPKIITKMAWSDNTIHSSFNQCVAVTGRLSSSKPNQQNIAPECKQLCISRYDY